MKKLLIVFFATAAIYTSGFAQLGTPLSQFSGNQMVYNPGYAGIYDLFSANLSYHQSWIQIPGAPRLVSLNAHAPFKNERHAWGGVFQNAQWGPLTDNSLHGNYAYKIHLRKGVLSLGLQAGLMVHTINWSNVDVDDPTDPFYGEGRKNDFKFNANVGAYYLANQWYAGFSVIHVNNPKYDRHNINGVDWYSQMRSQYFLIGGYNFNIDRHWSFRPEVMLRYVYTVDVFMNIGAHAYYNNRYSIGVNYLTGQNGVSFQAKANITDRFRIGYSYDVFFGTLRHHQRGSHEISVNYLIRNIRGNARTIDLLWL